MLEEVGWRSDKLETLLSWALLREPFGLSHQNGCMARVFQGAEIEGNV